MCLGGEICLLYRCLLADNKIPDHPAVQRQILYKATIEFHTVPLFGIWRCFCSFLIIFCAMKFDTWLLEHDLHTLPAVARAAEAVGFDGLWTAETAHNPFFPLVLAAEHTGRLSLGTAIAVTFPRSPTILAHIAWDLARYSHGRFILGLGPQVKAHNERRLGATWDRPLRRMRETIEAMHAIWDNWQHGTPLNYQGGIFQLNLMTPFFSGGRLDVPRPPIYLSAVNGQMLCLAGAVADGVLLHPFHTLTYLRDFAWHQLRQGFAENGRSREQFTAVGSLFVVPTDGRKPAGHYEQFARQQIAFYMSTPAYRVVAEQHGWEGTARQLSQLAREGKWSQMPTLLSDEMMDAFAITGRWSELPHLALARYGDLLDRLSFYLPFVPGEEDEGWGAAVAGFKA